MIILSKLWIIIHWSKSKANALSLSGYLSCLEQLSVRLSWNKSENVLMHGKMFNVNGQMNKEKKLNKQIEHVLIGWLRFFSLTRLRPCYAAYRLFAIKKKEYYMYFISETDAFISFILFSSFTSLTLKWNTQQPGVLSNANANALVLVLVCYIIYVFSSLSLHLFSKLVIGKKGIERSKKKEIECYRCP